jgi:signal transduction histidine kinase
MVGSLCIILVISLLFLLYDYFFRQVVCHKQAVLEAKRIFVRFISHELRTPMNTISIGSTLLQETLSKYTNQHATPNSMMDTEHVKGPIGSNDNPNPNPDSLRYLQDQLRDWSDITSDILVNANSAVNVLSDLLNYDKVNSGTLPLELSIISIPSLVHRVASEFRLAAHAKNIVYNIDTSSLVEDYDDHEKHQSHSDYTKETCISEDCEGVADIGQRYTVGDTVRLCQILRSFISNAFEFTENDGKQNALYLPIILLRCYILLIVSLESSCL